MHSYQANLLNLHQYALIESEVNAIAWELYLEKPLCNLEQGR